jgi:hypothetical protein
MSIYSLELRRITGTDSALAEEVFAEGDFFRTDSAAGLGEGAFSLAAGVETARWTFASDFFEATGGAFFRVLESPMA